jgi:hypothetical protein
MANQEKWLFGIVSPLQPITSYRSLSRWSVHISETEERHLLVKEGNVFESWDFQDREAVEKPLTEIFQSWEDLQDRVDWDFLHKWTDKHTREQRRESGLFI